MWWNQILDAKFRHPKELLKLQQKAVTAYFDLPQFTYLHIFAVIDGKQLPQIAPDTVTDRWILQHMGEVFDHKVNRVDAD